jgi:hypothetical protein
MKGRRKSDQPEEKGWFIKVYRAVIPRNDPVSGADHLPGYLRIPEIIMILKASVPEIEK